MRSQKNTEGEELVTPNTGDQDLQTPPFAADKLSQQTKQAFSPSIVGTRDSQFPSLIIEDLQASPSAAKALLGETSTAPSKENSPLSLVKKNVRDCALLVCVLFGHFKNGYYTLLLLLQTGTGSTSVLLGASICSLAIISRIDWSRLLVFGPSLHMGYANLQLTF